MVTASSSSIGSSSPSCATAVLVVGSSQTRGCWAAVTGTVIVYSAMGAPEASVQLMLLPELAEQSSWSLVSTGAPAVKSAGMVSVMSVAAVVAAPETVTLMIQLNVPPASTTSPVSLDL